MRVLGIVNQKGGAGKTTVAINLSLAAAEAGYATLLIDADPQASASFWADQRPAETRIPLEVSAVPAQRIPQAIELARNAGAELVIIDTAPHAEQSALAIARAVDGLLIPCQPSVLDVEALRATVQLIKLAAKPALAIGNGIQPGASRRFDDLKAALEGQGLSVAPIWLAARAVHRQALAERMGVMEYEPEGAATREIGALFRHVAEWVALPAKTAAAA